MRSRISFIIALIAGVLLPATAQNFSPSSWSGTGWALNQGYVVTNHHVIDDARSIVCKFYKGDEMVGYSAEVVQDDEETDLAILKITDPRFPGFGQLPYAFKQGLAEVGESVFVLGYPMTTTMGDEIKLTTGVLSSRSGYENDKHQYQISAPVQPGNSGGALFDRDGNVIGIINAKHTGAENVSYAIKSQYLMPLIDRLPEGRAVLPAANSIRSLELKDQVRLVRGYVCYIICSSRQENDYYTPPTRRNDDPYGDSYNNDPNGDSSKSYENTPSGSTYRDVPSRDFLRQNIEEWGDCRNVAITKTNGDVALHGRNGWAGSGLPADLSQTLHELNQANEYIDDVQLTENGSWCVLYGDNGFRWNYIPPSLEKEIYGYHHDNEVIYSVTFNDEGDWILIGKDHYSASSTQLLTFLKEGAEQFGTLLAACLTDDGLVACYDRGYTFLGNVPEDLKDRLRETQLDVYRIKIAGEAFFFADKDGSYRYKM